MGAHTACTHALTHRVCLQSFSMVYVVMKTHFWTPNYMVELWWEQLIQHQIFFAFRDRRPVIGSHYSGRWNMAGIGPNPIPSFITRSSLSTYACFCSSGRRWRCESFGILGFLSSSNHHEIGNGVSCCRLRSSSMWCLTGKKLKYRRRPSWALSRSKFCLLQLLWHHG